MFQNTCCTIILTGMTRQLSTKLIQRYGTLNMKLYEYLKFILLILSFFPYIHTHTRVCIYMNVYIKYVCVYIYILFFLFSVIANII